MNTVDVLAAVVAGLIAGPLMEAPAYLQRLLRQPLHQDVFAESGRLLRVTGRGQHLVGYLGHTTLSALISILYAVFFNAAGAVEGLVPWGMLGGFVHFIIGGLVVHSAFPVLAPEVLAPGTRTLGFAYANYGARDVLTFLGGHLAFGALVGALYPVLHPALTASAWF